MYRFDLKETFPGKPGEVLHRSTMSFEDFVKHMPNVSRVEELSRKKVSEEIEEMEVRFHADSPVPAIARSFVPRDINWKEKYIINYEKNTADWVVETPVFTEYVNCCGTSNIVEISADHCELHITGTMTIDVPNNFGVGRKMGQKVIEVIEPFIGNMVMKNLQKYFRSLKKAMEKEKGQG